MTWGRSRLDGKITVKEPMNVKHILALLAVFVIGGIAARKVAAIGNLYAKVGL